MNSELHELKPLVPLDADNMGHLLNVIADYHTMVMVRLEEGLVGPCESADTCYMIGNIEGRLKYNNLTQDDLEVLDAWTDELNAWKEHNDGKIIRL